jgi:hypothetical protein
MYFPEKNTKKITGKGGGEDRNRQMLQQICLEFVDFSGGTGITGCTSVGISHINPWRYFASVQKNSTSALRLKQA